MPDGHWHDAWVFGPMRLPQTPGAAASDLGASPHTPPCGTHAPTCEPFATLSTGVQLVPDAQSAPVLQEGKQ